MRENFGLAITHGPGTVYWSAPGQAQSGWMYLGQAVCPTCQDTGRTADLERCPFGCLELQHMSQGRPAAGRHATS